MIENIAIFISLVIAVEATTEIVTASEFPLFFWFRWKLAQYALPETPRTGFKQSTIIAAHKLFTCGYCFSVWAAGLFALFAPQLISHWFWNWLCTLLLLHRLANWLHMVYELIKKGRVISLDIEAKTTTTLIVDDHEFGDNDDDDSEDVDGLIDSLENQ